MLRKIYAPKGFRIRSAKISLLNVSRSGMKTHSLSLNLKKGKIPIPFPKVKLIKSTKNLKLSGGGLDKKGDYVYVEERRK
jgi:hypothetical protein